MTVSVLYHQDQDTWVGYSPNIANWTVVADTYDDARRLVEEGVRFALERDDVRIEHCVPASA